MCALTLYNACVPEGLGTPGDRRGAESMTSGVNLVAVSVILVRTVKEAVNMICKICNKFGSRTGV